MNSPIQIEIASPEIKHEVQLLDLPKLIGDQDIDRMLKNDKSVIVENEDNQISTGLQVDDHKLIHPFLPFSKYTYILTVF